MKRILCFGDSNTYGYMPGSGLRYDKKSRWTGILQTLLGDEYLIIEAGCNNRTCYCKNTNDKMLTGIDILPDYLDKNLDYIILFIGINDLQFIYSQSLIEIKNGFESFLKLIKNQNTDAKIIILSPPVLNKNILSSNFRIMFDESSIEKSLHLSDIYQNIAEKFNCEFYDLNNVISVSELDGLHFNSDAHLKIAEILKLVIKNL